jgi:hypothetical protein
VTSARNATLVLCLLVSSDAFAANFNVTNTNASGSGSLAQAITNANATAAADTISFQLFGLSEQVISGDLPAITQPLTIDGYTQLFSSDNSTDLFATNANILVILDGSTLPTGEPVLQVDAGPTTIRGLEIRGIKAQGVGIRVGASVTQASILGCFIGTDGTMDRSDGTGIRVDGTAMIGSDLEEDRNLISGNDTAGVVLRGPDSVVRNNLIGGTAAGGEGIGNGAGIIVQGAAASGNYFGDEAPTTWNVIHHNTLDGIRIDITAGDGNAILMNSISDNGQLGIDLEDDGVTENDEDDLDDGPNGLQNFPELTFARMNGTFLTVEGMLNSHPGTYQVVVYFVVPGEPSGFGEGGTPRGAFFVVIPEGETIATFSQVIDMGNVIGEEFDISATARDIESDNSSEFSRQRRVVFGGSEYTVTNTSDSGAGSLRQALEDTKNHAGPDTILFAIPGPGPHTIKPLTSLSIASPTILDGYSQPLSSPNTLRQGSNADIRVVLDGSELPDAETRLVAAAGSDSVIRGLAIHSSPGDGILVLTGFRIRIEGNFIGMDSTGELDRGNGGSGVYALTGGAAVVGAASRGARNVISANEEAGVFVLSPQASIVNNIVGLSASLEPGFGNGWDGILLSDQDARVGSDEPDFGNVIYGNVGSGIALLGSGDEGNEFLGNSIDGNGDLGIDLNRGLVTPNDVDDADTGANALQNFPIIESVTQNGDEIRITGFLDVPADEVNEFYTIRFHSSPACNELGHGEGATFLSAAPVPFSGGEEDFEVSFRAVLESGVQVTATATEVESNNTSEFSPCFEYTIPGEQKCGDPNDDGDIAAGDALTALRTAVGTGSCEVCICDVNSAGGVTTTDALFILRKAVGQGVVLDCPDCD